MKELGLKVIRQQKRQMSIDHINVLRDTLIIRTWKIMEGEITSNEHLRFFPNGHGSKYHIWVDEHPFTSYFDVHLGYKVLTHNQISDEVLSLYCQDLSRCVVMGFDGSCKAKYANSKHAQMMRTENNIHSLNTKLNHKMKPVTARGPRGSCHSDVQQQTGSTPISASQTL